MEFAIIFGFVALGLILLLVHEAGVPRRLAEKLREEAESRGVPIVMSGLDGERHAYFVVPTIRAMDVAKAAEAMKNAPQSHANTAGGGGDFVRHVLFEVMARVAKDIGTYDEDRARAACERLLAQRGLMLDAYRTALDVPFDEGAANRRRWFISDCFHSTRPRSECTVDAFEIFLDGASGLGDWRVRVNQNGVWTSVPSTEVTDDPSSVVEVFTTESRIVRDVPFEQTATDPGRRER